MQIKILQEIDLKTQAGNIIYFLQRMDIEMINEMLDDKYTYQEFNKSVFIRKLDHALDEFISNGDTFLNCYTGFCDSEICNYKCSGYSFVGNKSGCYMDLIIEVKDGFVCDMCECAKFKNMETGVKKSKRIRIDNSPLPF